MDIKCKGTNTRGSIDLTRQPACGLSDCFRTVFETWDCFVEITCWFHSEISDCGHDVRGGRQSNRRSGYHLQVEMEQRHVCKWTWTAGHWREWALIMKMCWVSVCVYVCVLYLLSSSVYPVHQLVSTLTLLIQVQLQLSNPVLRNQTYYIRTVSSQLSINVCVRELTIN